MEREPFDRARPHEPLSVDPFQPQPGGSGNYEVLGELGRGAQGRILSAWDRRLRRSVAIKELLGSDEAARLRFEREALITARLQHPGIVNVYEAGRWPDGKTFYAMRLVEGNPLSAVLAITTSFAGRLQLLPHVIDVVEALAYAHSRRIIHRDLKPGNVLVGKYGETVVVDWGLAKDLTASESDVGRDTSQPDAETVFHDTSRDEAPAGPTLAQGSPSQAGSSNAALTMAGGILGTPAYMSPEQARGEPADERSDVYALGGILYHLLAGEPAYYGATSQSVLADVLGRAPMPMEMRQPGIPRELKDIVEKAMARDPGERYPTAGELAQELRRFEGGQLVGAHTYTTWELVQRWFRRHRAAVVVGAVGLLLLSGLASVSVTRIVRARNAAEAARHRADERADEITLVQARSWLERNPGHALAWLKELSPGSRHFAGARLLAEEARAMGVHQVLTGNQGRVWYAALSPDGRLIASAGDDGTVRVWDLEARTARVFTGHRGLVKHVVFSPDSRVLASASQDGTVRVWDPATGGSRVFTGHKDFVRRLAFFPDGMHLASASWDGTVRVWEVETGESLVLDGRPARMEDVDVSPDGRWVAGAGDDGAVRVWDAAGGEGRVVARHSAITDHVVFSPDGRLLASGGQSDTLWVYAMDGSGLRAFPGDPNLTHVAFSPDGSLLATSSFTGAVRLWDMAGGETRGLTGHEGEVFDLAFDPEGKRLATTGVDGSVLLWDLASGEFRPLRGHEDWVLHAEFSAAGGSLVTCGLDKTVRLWNVGFEDDRVFQADKKEVMGVVFSRTGGTIASYGSDAVQLWDAATGEERTLTGHHGVIRSIAFSPDGSLLASACGDKTVRIWDVHGDGSRELTGHEGGVETIAFSPDGSRLASAGIDNTVRLWNVADGSSRVWGGHEAKISDLAFSPDGKRLASASADNTIRLWDVATGEGRVLTGHDGWVRRVVFSPRNADILASSSDDGTVRVWDLRAGTSLALTGHEGSVRALAFSPGGDLLASGGDDALIRLWDVAGGAGRVFRGHDGAVMEVEFSPNGDVLVSAGGDGTVRLWDAVSGVSRVMRGHRGAVTGAAFSPDGRVIASSSLDGSVRLWRDDLPVDAPGLRKWLDAATNAVIGPANEVEYPWGNDDGVKPAGAVRK